MRFKALDEGLGFRLRVSGFGAVDEGLGFRLRVSGFLGLGFSLQHFRISRFSV